ncbi:MAG: hypothetical protein COA58_10810 [Bacteroidetes bacterium]|nr:MAG: hypothetical protein COA58_10810 [Bacteroidota bacterium]
MQKIRPLLSIILIGFTLTICAQNSVIDSLQNIILTNDDKSIRIKTLYQIALEQLDGGYPITAKETALQIINQRKIVEDKQVLVNTYLVLSKSYSQTYVMDSSLHFLKIAKKLALEYSYTAEFFKCQVRLANYLINEGNFDQSDSVASQAINDLLDIKQNLSEELNQQLAQLYATRGLIPLYLNTNLSKCRPDLRKAIEIYEQNGSKYDECSALINLGYSFHFNNEFDSALHYYLANLTVVRERAFRKQEVSLVGNISDIFQVTNNPEKAKSVYLEYLSQERNFSPDEKSLAYAGIVNILHAQSKTQEASKYVKKLIPLTDSISRFSKFGHCITIANQFFHEEKWDSLGIYVGIAKNHITGPHDANSLLYLDAILDQHSNKKSEAKRKFLSLFQDQQDIVLKSQVSGNLAEIYESELNFSKALHYYKLTNELNDSLENVETQRIINDASTKYETEKKEVENKLLKAQNAEQMAITKAVTLKNRSWSIATLGALLIALFSGLWFNQKRKATQQELTMEKQNFSQRIEQQENKNLQAILDALENERTRIAQDIHDRIGAGISTVKLYFEGIKELVGKGDKQVEENFKHVDQLLATSISELRKVSHNMISGVLADFGLVPALQGLRDTIQSSGKISCTLDTKGLESRLDKNIGINVYRIVQELISNSIKYSDCTDIAIEMQQLEGQLTLRYTDNGKGFDPNKINIGLGYKNIQSRITSLKGSLTNNSEIHKGASYQASIPIEITPIGDETNG